MQKRIAGLFSEHNRQSFLSRGLNCGGFDIFQPESPASNFMPINVEQLQEFIYRNGTRIFLYQLTNWKRFHFVYSSIFSLRCEVCLNLECKGEEVHYWSHEIFAKSPAKVYWPFCQGLLAMATVKVWYFSKVVKMKEYLSLNQLSSSSISQSDQR